LSGYLVFSIFIARKASGGKKWGKSRAG
jgi:hypothetical protein